MLEISAGWARNLVTAMARIDGRPVGVIANQPRYLGGVLDAASSEKGARFVAKCNSFGLPLLVLVDTPGFMPGMRQESAAVIRHGASLVHAFAQATVPRVTVILRKAFGGAFITMNSKDLGADYVFAWPNAEIGVMGSKPAVGVIHRRELALAEDPEAERERLARRYADQQLRPEVAAGAGYVDELIAPSDTRSRVVWALGSLPERDELVPAAGCRRADLSSGPGDVLLDRDDRLRGHGAAGPLPRARRTPGGDAGASRRRRGRPGADRGCAREPVW